VSRRFSVVFVPRPIVLEKAGSERKLWRYLPNRFRRGINFSSRPCSASLAIARQQHRGIGPP
jgi:hypothetical protein